MIRKMDMVHFIPQMEMNIPVIGLTIRCQDEAFLFGLIMIDLR
jgi:hypothetical protein